MIAQFQRQGLPSRLTLWAFVLYLVSYCLPAAVISGDLAFGFEAALLSFAGVIAEEPGSYRFNACLLGALANVLMVGGCVSYSVGCVCYSVRRCSKTWRRSFRVASRLTGLAAICALGAAVILENGQKSFEPRIGYYVWLASMILISFGCWRRATTVECEPGAAPNGDPTPPAMDP